MHDIIVRGPDTISGMMLKHTASNNYWSRGHPHFHVLSIRSGKVCVYQLLGKPAAALVPRSPRALARIELIHLTIIISTDLFTISLFQDACYCVHPC